MKKLSALLLLALGLSVIPAAFSADKKPAAPAKPATPAAAPAPAPAKQEAIVGILIERKAGGFLNLRVDNGNFTIAFLDQDKKPVDADLARAVLRFRRHLKNNTYILNRSGDGKTLTCAQPINRPYLLPALPVVLFKDAGDADASEVYTVNFKQPMPGDGESTPLDEMTPEQREMIK